MISNTHLRSTAREYLRAAKLLRTRRSYNVAFYLCGYALEIALKAQICRTLNWRTGFPETSAEFKLKSNLKTHDLEALLEFTGIQDKIKLRYFSDWATANKWKPEQRYSPPGTKTRIEAEEMIEATQNLLRILL